ncbi:TRAF3-interacting protein 1-like isoform X2 [Porites lutea]|uniref:TRAF3-interacting protein 1-like isoform X2 n=1 Tax=Porites lutea TaxID=51062 RepID=UPI003CC6AA7E
MDQKVAKKTQDTLGKVIKKPPLTDKLLSKPPFRFLHDIITEVIRNTGFLKGLYTPDEMDSANVKDKEAKIAFLQKAIDVVGMINGQLSVRPSKIVAGHEPEKTNEFLQSMGTAILNKKSSSDAVKKVLAGEKPGKESSDGKRKESRTGSGGKERERSKERDKTEKEREKSRDRDKENDKDKDRRKQSDAKKKDGSSNKTETSDRRKKDDSAKREKEREERSSEKIREKAPKKEDDIDGVDSGAGVIDGELENGELPANRIPRPSSAKDLQEGEVNGPTMSEQVRPTEEMNGELNHEELPPQVIKSRSIPRPSSARPAPPKIKKQQEELEDQMARIGSGKQVASVIVDDGKDQDDEDDTFVVEDAHAIQNDLDMTPAGEVAEDDGEHGGLVREILKTKKELEGGGNQEARPRQERQAPIMSDAARRKERELAQKEIEKLRTSIQTLTRSANPLGKIMDYIQEDMDSMQKELDLWRRENVDHEIALRREESITESEIAPLKSQLEELDTEITEMVDRISTVKCNILRNDEKIQKMLSSVSITTR